MFIFDLKMTKNTQYEFLCYINDALWCCFARFAFVLKGPGLSMIHKILEHTLTDLHTQYTHTYIPTDLQYEKTFFFLPRFHELLLLRNQCLVKFADGKFLFAGKQQSPITYTINYSEWPTVRDRPNSVTVVWPELSLQ